ncbi:MAG: hypothetical protein M3O50_09675, partial [Myxococcota bacterium]|nr:hypothetical protein [Myxococcota bacterium]
SLRAWPGLMGGGWFRHPNPSQESPGPAHFPAGTYPPPTDKSPAFAGAPRIARCEQKVWRSLSRLPMTRKAACR